MKGWVVVGVVVAVVVAVVAVVAADGVGLAPAVSSLGGAWAVDPLADDVLAGALEEVLLCLVCADADVVVVVGVGVGTRGSSRSSQSRSRFHRPR